jgi:AcrR family transcriptional regulator
MAGAHERSERTRVRIIEAARLALLDGGGDFELVDLSRRAGVSVGLPYHRFGSKSGVVAAVVAQFHDGIRRAIDLGDCGERDWALRERERLRRLIDYLYAEPLSALILATLGRDPHVAGIEAALWAETIDSASRNLAKAQARGEVPKGLDPVLAAAAICGGVRHAVGRALQEQPRRCPRALLDALWTMNARLLGLSGARGTTVRTARARLSG